MLFTRCSRSLSPSPPSFRSVDERRGTSLSFFPVSSRFRVKEEDAVPIMPLDLDQEALPLPLERSVEESALAEEARWVGTLKALHGSSMAQGNPPGTPPPPPPPQVGPHFWRFTSMRARKDLRATKELEKMITVATSSQSFDPSLGIPKWLMLDSSVVVGKLVNGTRSTFRSGGGLEFSISLQASIPPASSYVHLGCAQAVTPPTEEHGFYGACSVVAADGELLLVRVIVPVKGEYGYEYPVEYFIYTHNLLTPSIEFLPFMDCDMDGEWARWHGVLGITRCGKSVMVVGFRKKIVVDDTSKGTRKELVQLGRFCSHDRKWVLEEIELPYDLENGLEPFQWETAFAFSYGNRMSFVDFKTGLMFCDIFNYSPKLQYVKFPVPVRKVNFSFDNVEEEGVPIESYRSVGVCDGKIKFVSVDSCCSKTTGPTIKTWTLCVPEMLWEEDSILDVKHLWATAFKASRLPRWVPRFPVVDAQDPDILHFVLLGPNYHDRVWIITIDMKTVTLKSCKNYRNADRRDEYKGIFMYKPFLCSVLSKYIVGPSDWQVDGNRATMWRATMDETRV